MTLHTDTLAQHLTRARGTDTAALKSCREACRRLIASEDPTVDLCQTYVQLLGIVEFVLWERRTGKQKRDQHDLARGGTQARREGFQSSAKTATR